MSTGRRNWKLLSLLLGLLIYLSGAQEIPDLPNYFSGYVETITRVGEGTATLRLAREFYDLTANLTRMDLAAEAVSPGNLAGGMRSIVQDLNLKLQYQINRQYRNCTVGLLLSNDTAAIYRKLDSNHFFYLVNTSEFVSDGSSDSNDGVATNNWIHTGNFSYGGMAFINASVRVFITQSGVSVPAISAITSNPTPWQLSINGMALVNGKMENISVVSKFYDLSFKKPQYEVFDVAYCATPTDSVVLNLAVPLVDSLSVDYDGYRSSLHQAIVEYTQLYPTQVGQIETTMNNRVLLSSVVLSNISSKANVTRKRSANSAYEMIVENSEDSSAPFEVPISDGSSLIPEILLRTDPQNCSSDVEPTTPTPSNSDQNEATSALPISPTPCPMSSCSCSIPTTTETVTVTGSASQSCPEPILPTPPPIIVSSTVIKSSSGPTQTSSCPVPTPSVCPSPRSDPSRSYSTSRVVGISFGMVFLGIFLTLATIFMGFLFYNQCVLRNSDRSRSGYHKHIDSSSKPHNSYFQ